MNASVVVDAEKAQYPLSPRGGTVSGTVVSDPSAHCDEFLAVLRLAKKPEGNVCQGGRENAGRPFPVEPDSTIRALRREKLVPHSLSIPLRDFPIAQMTERDVERQEKHGASVVTPPTSVLALGNGKMTQRSLDRRVGGTFSLTGGDRDPVRFSRREGMTGARIHHGVERIDTKKERN